MCSAPPLQADIVRVTLFLCVQPALYCGEAERLREIYCEGRIRLNQWTGKDGEPRAGLQLTAWVLQPLGQIGRRGPRRQPAAAGSTHGDFDEAPF